MKSKHIIYPMVIVLMLVVPVLRYYVSTPDVNGCVLDYVDNLKESNFQWYMYDINGVKHIEPKNSNMIHSLAEYEIWRSHGCLMTSNNLLSDLNNTFYCAITYMIRNAPIDEKFKEPLGILERE